MRASHQAAIFAAGTRNQTPGSSDRARQLCLGAKQRTQACLDSLQARLPGKQSFERLWTRRLPRKTPAWEVPIQTSLLLNAG